MRRRSIAIFVFALAWLSSQGATAKVPDLARSLGSCAGFVSHAEIGSLLDGYEETYPDIARVQVLGSSVEGREIYALTLSADPDVESAEPEIRIIGGIHGNECASVQLVVELVEVLVGGYGEAGIGTDLIDGAELVFVPLVNPDGYSGETARRANANGVDLNRNFGFAWYDEGPAPFSEPESRALRDLSLRSSFVLGLSYHTVAQYVNAAWNYTPFHPPDEELFVAIGEGYAGDSSYKVTFGWDWYNISGDVNDWSLGVTGAFDWTVELRNDHQLEYPVHAAGVAGFMSFVFMGISGVVVDAETGDPLAARVEIEPEGAPVYTDPDVGDYHRVLLPGRYDLTVRAQGYAPLTVEEIEVVEDEVTLQDFELVRAAEDEPRFAFRVTEMVMPREVGLQYKVTPYLNASRAWDALGPPDGRAYSMSPGGSVVLDVGAAAPVVDREGVDLIVRSASGSSDPARVFLAVDQDGVFVEAADGHGDIPVDMATADLGLARYVMVVDEGDGPFNAAEAGYDLDAVETVEEFIPVPDAGPDADTDVDTDTESESASDVDTDTESDAGEPDTATDEDAGIGSASGGCGCTSAGRKGPSPIANALFSLLQ